MVGINHIGENVIDLECIVADINGAEIRGIDVEDNGKTNTKEALVFPDSNKNLEFVIYDPTVNKYYQGRISTSSRGIVNENSLLAVTQKFDQFGGLVPIDETIYSLSKGIKLKVTRRNPGGGAINCGTAIQVFLNSLNATDMINRVVVPNGDNWVRDFLKDNYNLQEYRPQGWNTGAGLNVNISFEGKTFTLRSPYNLPYKNKKGYDLDFVQEGDFVVINTIKDKEYLDGLLGEIAKKNTKKILVATDSSIKSIGRGYIQNLLQNCSVVISNDQELDILVNDRDKGRKLAEEGKYEELATAMQKIGGNDKTVYTTLGKQGIAVYFGGHIYKQRISVAEFQVDTENGCGDATAALIVLYAILGYDPLNAMVDANVAGQIKATESSGIATKESITQFKEAYRLAPIEVYRQSEKRFVPISEGR